MRDNGGHAVALWNSMRMIYGVEAGDVVPPPEHASAKASKRETATRRVDFTSSSMTGTPYHRVKSAARKSGQPDESDGPEGEAYREAVAAINEATGSAG